MQNIGLQTVLQLSNAAERVQQTAQQQGALSAEQFKDVMDKQSDLKKIEVQTLDPKDDLKIRDEDRARHENPQQQAAEKEAKGGETAEESIAEASLPVGSSDQGRLLNIKV